MQNNPEARLGRRDFLKSGSSALIAMTLMPGGMILGANSAWSATPKAISATSFATLVQACRDIYPHDHLADSFYAKVVEGFDAATAADAAEKAVLEDGATELDAAAQAAQGIDYIATGWEIDRVDILRTMQDSVIFGKMKGALVGGIYGNPDVWPLFGYEGESASRGGYLNRGFDDIDWIDQVWEKIKMTTFDMNDDSVVVVVGSGAGGGTLGAELAMKGVKTVVLEAGGRHEIQDFSNDEWGMFSQISWLDKRTTSGDWRVAKDFSGLPAWIVKAVGGSTVHWAGASLRIQEHEFKTKTHYGEIDGASLLDWPIDVNELNPWYDMAEDRMGVTRTNGIPGLPGNNNFKIMKKGADILGYKECHTGRMAINSEPRDGRGSCQQIGFCFQGCKTGAKWSTLYVEIPKGEKTGNLEVRPHSQVLKIEHDDSGKATGVMYADKDGNMHVQKARVVCVAGNSIESPRLLLNSNSSMFPDGLANSSGKVGKNYMRHMTGSVYAIFDKPVNMYRGTTMAGIIEDESRFDTSRGFAGGYEMETLSLGLPFMGAFLDPGAWGREFTSAMEGYENMAGMWLVGEDMPQQSNRITLHATEKDQYGQPAPNVHFDDHPNDIAMRNHAFQQGATVYDAVGATRTFPTPPYPSTHNLGTNRMSDKADEGVVNKWGRTHDVPNLFVSDGSVFTTSAAENPTLTIVALALRQADHIASQMSQKNL